MSGRSIQGYGTFEVQRVHLATLEAGSARHSKSGMKMKTRCHDHELHDADGRSILRKAIAHGFLPM
uniref:Uncharacterized protein n=1 Tax=Oryza rufipogon TaxID=4529 RepID=A0A0E0MXL7_ORYRU